MTLDLDDLARLRANYLDTRDRYSAGRVTFAAMCCDQAALADAAAKALPGILEWLRKAEGEREALDAARAEEREACATEAHEVGQRLWDSSTSPHDELQTEAAGAWAAERAIRGRG